MPVEAEVAERSFYPVYNIWIVDPPITPPAFDPSTGPHYLLLMWVGAMVESSNSIKCWRVVFGSGIRGVKEKPRLRRRERKPQMRPKKGRRRKGRRVTSL